MIDEMYRIDITNLERLKLELGNKAYYTDEEYKLFLQENDLYFDDDYKDTDKINILRTVRDILETLANDVDIMRKIDSKDILTTSQASTYLQNRIENVNRKIFNLEYEMNKETNVKPLFF